jgi:hypothetical protein
VPGPRQPLLDATITQVGTEEKYTVAPVTQEVVKVMRLLANALENGQVRLRHTSIGATLKRECKFKDTGELEAVELALHTYFSTDPDFVIGGVKLMAADVVHEPEIMGASPVGTLPTR